MTFEGMNFSGYAQSAPTVTDDLIAHRLEALRRLAEKLTTEIQVLSKVKPTKADCGIDYYEEVKAFEIALIERALCLSNGKQIKAAGCPACAPQPSTKSSSVMKFS